MPRRSRPSMMSLVQIPVMIQRYGVDASDGCLFDSGQRPAPAQHLAHQHCLLGSGSIDIGFGIVGHGQPGAHSHHILRIESQPHVEHIPETTQQKPRRDHQHQREPKFRHHQHAPPARLLARSGCAALLLP